MPLARRINFKANLTCGRVKIPVLYRHHYKLETSQVLKVTVNIEGDWSNREVFLTHMRKDGNLGIPERIRRRLQGSDSSLEGYCLDVTVEPA